MTARKTWTDRTNSTSGMTRGTSGLATAAATTWFDPRDLLRASAAVLEAQTSIISKGQTRLIFNRDREGNILSFTTVTGLQSTTVTTSGNLVGRALGTNEHQTVVDERFERVGTAVRNGERIQLWLNDSVSAGYSLRVGSVINHYTILHEFCGYSTMEANDNSLAPACMAA